MIPVSKKDFSELHFSFEEEINIGQDANNRIVLDESPNDTNSMEDLREEEDGCLGDCSYEADARLWWEKLAHKFNRPSPTGQMTASPTEDLSEYLKDPLQRDLSRYLPKQDKKIYFPKEEPSDLTKEDLKVHQAHARSFPPTFGCVFPKASQLGSHFKDPHYLILGEQQQLEEEFNFPSPAASMSGSPFETLEEFLRTPTPKVSFPKKIPSGLTPKDLTIHRVLSKSYPPTVGCVFPPIGIEACPSIGYGENGLVDSGWYEERDPDIGLTPLLKTDWFK